MGEYENLNEKIGGFNVKKIRIRIIIILGSF